MSRGLVYSDVTVGQIDGMLERLSPAKAKAIAQRLVSKEALQYGSDLSDAPAWEVMPFDNNSPLSAINHLVINLYAAAYWERLRRLAKVTARKAMEVV